MDYAAQFLTISVLHLAAVVSPGPDFALVLRESVSHCRRCALWASVGIGTGIFVHTGYSLLGFGLLVKSSVLAFTVMKFAAAAYLAWIGWKALRAKPVSLDLLPPPPAGAGPTDASGASAPATALPLPSSRACFVMGFATNALNPKATLFFLSVFSVVIAPETPRWVQASYGVWMAVVTALWFCLVSVFFTQRPVLRVFSRLGHWFERAMGALLLALGVRLAFATAK